jgi:hypothetical protein
MPIERRLILGGQEYHLGGVTYALSGHYILKLLPPMFSNYFVYDNLRPDQLRRTGLHGRPNLYIYFHSQ